MPKISVVMSCYNESSTVAKAIESILCQSFKDFEFIIIDDGSTDNTLNIIKHYAALDTRIQVINNNNNNGLAAALNKGIKLAKGKYIARMDADDESLEDRLLKQVKFLENSSSVDVLGTNAYLISDGHKSTSNLPLSNEEIFRNKYKKTIIIHPTVMIREKIFSDYGGYNNALPWAEDKDLWLRWMNLNEGKQVTFGNLAEPLLNYKVKGKINARIFYYNHYVLVVNMLRSGALLSNFHLLVRSMISHLIRKNG